MKNGYTIIPLNTWYGQRWAVVDEKRNVVTMQEGVSSYPYDKDGLAKARKVMEDLRSRKQ